ncbi:diacylglycerol kinase family protein [Aestuariimicrobium sp. T2.26MG-19.2B]|uniref:diacylglycerol kinase family protein n=1 Tax=Aestuariimicrobium sp. T2.26MG-19.2B TaxID=3040679 RepID=UPI0024775D62|nr:diacylglycerol kinase family protein [Aestuariimicrobium sp. T2.26MG-19.2B]CAI9402514.1 lipid kinase YegS [Aestuariimicrobium sp. T2.26MG-19.2B]
MAPRPHPVRLAAWTSLGFGVAFAVFTWLTLRTTVLAPLDADHFTVQPGTWWAEAATAIAFVTQPVVVMPLLTIALGWWALRANLRRFGTAVVVAASVGWLVDQLFKRVLHRPRPPNDFSELSTDRGWAYPSGHVLAFTVAAILVSVAVTIARRKRRTQVLVRVLAVLTVVAIGVNRWLLAAHHTTDLVGAVLLGACLTSLSLWVCGVHVDPRWALAPPAVEGPLPRCAVIVNPAKVLDLATFRRVLTRELAARGWAEPLWFETSVADPGHQMARDAIAAKADLVLAAGGDGTVRIVAGELAGSGVPLALIPSGTANLLAHNLGVPTDLDAALALALDGRPSAIDLLKVTVDGRAGQSEHVAVMAGLGIDGLVMASTDPRLKRTVKSVAYAVAIAQNLLTPPVQATVTLDGHVIHEGPATLMLVGNVGEVQSGLSLFPEADPSDGLLDVVVTAPRNVGEWFAYGVGVLLRRRHKVLMRQGRHLRFDVAEPLPYELDGDTIDQARSFEARIEPGCLLIVRP